MARKTVTIQDPLGTNEEFEAYLENNHNKLICLEVYSEFCGHCLATAFAIRKGKLEIGQDRVAMARAASDKIDALSRFRNKSEPVFLFISGKLIRAMFGANGIELCRILEEELDLTQQELKSGVEKPKWNIHELLPEETAKVEEDLQLAEQRRAEKEGLRASTVAARKRRIAARLAVHLARYNFIVFWPHCHQAHFDLYEKWSVLDIQVSAKEEVQMTEDGVRELLYMSDLDPNEACLHALMDGDALLVMFKMYETDDRNFVEIMRQALYEEIPQPKDEAQETALKPAFDTYATISKTKREVRRDRYNARMQKLREEREERERLAAEQARLAREAEEDRARLETQRREEERMARIQAGLPDEPEPVPEEAVEEALSAETEAAEPEHVAEEQVQEVEPEEEFHSDVSVEDEAYIPPGGLLVPGLYSPPNDLAKANGLAYFFPKVVSQITAIESEHLPPHALVVFPADKRYQVEEVMQQYPEDILNYGMFVGEEPAIAEHVAYTITQYDKMDRLAKHKDRMAVMVSRSRSLPLLQLAGLSPCYISHDDDAGESDCRALFPVGYGDDYVEDEDEEVENVEDENADNADQVPVPAQN